MINLRIFTFLFLVAFGAKGFAADLSFVNCKGQMSKAIGGRSSVFLGSIRILPYQQSGRVSGQVEWKASVSTSTGDYEIKPIASNYSLPLQTLTFSHYGNEGEFELVIGLTKSEQIKGNHRGDFGASFKVDSAQIGGIGLQCILSKYKIDSY